MTRKLADIKLTEQQQLLAEFMAKYHRRGVSIFIIHDARKRNVYFDSRHQKAWKHEQGTSAPRSTTLKVLIKKDVLVRKTQQNQRHQRRWDEDEYRLADDIEA